MVQTMLPLVLHRHFARQDWSRHLLREISARTYYICVWSSCPWILNLGRGEMCFYFSHFLVVETSHG